MNKIKYYNFYLILNIYSYLNIMYVFFFNKNEILLEILIIFVYYFL